MYAASKERSPSIHKVFGGGGKLSVEKVTESFRLEKTSKIIKSSNH